MNKMLASFCRKHCKLHQGIHKVRAQGSTSSLAKANFVRFYLRIQNITSCFFLLVAFCFAFNLNLFNVMYQGCSVVWYLPIDPVVVDDTKIYNCSPIF